MYTVKLSAVILVAAAVAALPPTPPPRVEGAPVAPPPAWAEVSRTSLWLAYGSYCWSEAGKAACADMIPPAQRPDLPVIRARRGQAIVVRLRFRASRIVVTVGGRRVVRTTGSTVSWQTARTGIVSVEAKVRGDGASYVARLRIR